MALVLLVTQPVRAEPRCPVSDRPTLELLLEVEPPDLAIAANLAEHLAAELRIRGIDLCNRPPAPRSPIARVRLRVDHPATGPVEATIQIEDAITAKRLERTIDLTSIPVDGRPLAVASSTDELLRASWVELSVTDSPPPAIAPPSAVLRAVADSEGPLPGNSPPRVEVGAEVDASTFFGHRDAAGGALALRGWFLPRVAGSLDAGGDLGLPRSSVHGTVRANDLFATAGAALAVVPRNRGRGLDVEAGVSLLRVSIASMATAGATATAAVDWAMLVRSGARAWARAGLIRWSAGLSGLAVIRASRGLDTGHDVTSIEGFGLEASLAGLVAF
jgi:hypothetical protein